MEVIYCQCENWPPHNHEYRFEGHYESCTEDIHQVVVDWKAVARSFVVGDRPVHWRRVSR